jgi:hypothetical protein
LLIEGGADARDGERSPAYGTRRRVSAVPFDLERLEVTGGAVGGVGGDAGGDIAGLPNETA